MTNQGLFLGAGTVINVIAIVLATLIGLLVGKKFSIQLRDLITQSMGLIVLIAAADALSNFWNQGFQSSFARGVPILIILFSLVLGALLGNALKLEKSLERFGDNLKNRFSRGENPRFVEGFITASILFVVGPMAILGGISDGMGEGIELLLLKSVLDFFMAIAFTASFGWGVGLSAIPVGIYQFGWTGVGAGLGAILNENQITSITVTGGLLLIGIALSSLGIKRIAVGNLLPAIFIAPILTTLLASS
jgi:uncharacterized membrane protein YqgA involved in biofilm formation